MVLVLPGLGLVLGEDGCCKRGCAVGVVAVAAAAVAAAVAAVIVLMAVVVVSSMLRCKNRRRIVYVLVGYV